MSNKRNDPSSDKGGYKLAEEETGLPLGTIYSKVSKHTIPHIRLGKRLVVFSRDELRQWLNAHKVKTVDAESAEDRT